MPWLSAASLLLAAATLTLALRPDGTVFLVPLSEDGYYAMTIARNIADGHGVTIDGVTPTNGFQPLFTFLQAGLFALAGGSDALAIRLILGLHWLLQVGTALLVGLIARDAVAGGPARLRQALATFLYLAATHLFLHHYNGLETGCLLFLLALVWRQIQAGGAESRGGLVLLGLLLGLLALTRIDTGALIGCLCLRELVIRRDRGWATALSRAVLLGLLALLFSSPWWIYNWIGFGSPMPISGQAQQGWALEALRWRWLGWALGTGVLPWLYLGQYEAGWLDWLRLPLYLGGAWLVLPLLRGGGTAQGAPARSASFARALAAALLILALYYVLSFFAFWFYARYLAPVALLGTVALAIAAAPWLAARPLAARAASLVLLLPVAALAAFAWQGLSLYGTILFTEQLALVQRGVPPGALVAAGQSGTLGFFRPAVVNMDGKVNPEIHRWAGHPWDYLVARDIRWFVDWPYYVEKSLGPDPAAHGWRPVDREGQFILYRRDAGG
ncbi:MAG: hypothetical protein U1E53_15165 [Dongiaceae bacterium]